jgi:hypothetical protein
VRIVSYGSPLVPTESQQDASTRAALERQHIALAHVIAHGVLGVDPMDADAEIAVAGVDRHALAGLLGELVHQRKHDVSQAHASLIECPKDQRRGPDSVRTVVEPLQVAMPDQRLRDPQYRALVEPGPVRELGEREFPVRRLESSEDFQRPVNGGDAAFVLRRAGRGPVRLAPPRRSGTRVLQRAADVRLRAEAVAGLRS